MMNAYELSLHGVGISIYPASISSLIRDKDVCVREVAHPDAHADYALIWNKNHTLSHVAEEFIAYIKECDNITGSTEEIDDIVNEWTEK